MIEFSLSKGAGRRAVGVLLPEKNGDLVRLIARDGKIKDAVVVEIAHDELPGKFCAGGISDGRKESVIATVDQHDHAMRHRAD